MSGADDLLGLAFAAVGCAPERPLVAGTDGVHRVPEFCRDAGVRRVLQHAGTLAVLDLPTDLAAELKVVALVIDRPTFVRLHVNSVAGIGDELVERERLFARKNADVGHTNHRQSIPESWPYP